MKIYSPTAFQKWAEREKGSRWFEDKTILKTYGKAQLMRLYPSLFR